MRRVVSSGEAGESGWVCFAWLGLAWLGLDCVGLWALGFGLWALGFGLWAWRKPESERQRGEHLAVLVVIYLNIVCN